MALDPHLLVPASADDLREPAGIVAIRLIGHHLQCGTGVPRIEDNDW
jgi:hypothetical protein